MKGMGWRDLQDVAWEGYARMPLHHAACDSQLEFVEYFKDEEQALLKCGSCNWLVLVPAEGCDLPEGVEDRQDP